MRLITQASQHDQLVIKGDRKPNSIGVCFAANNPVHVNKFNGSNVLVPMIHMSGKLNLNQLLLHHFGGDGINERSNDGLHIKKLIVRDDEIWLDTKKYHPDVLQAYAVLDDGHTVDPDGVVGNITIEHVDIITKNPKRQIFMFSESCENSHVYIGTKSLRVHCAYQYWFVANTLSHAVLGNCDVVDLQRIGSGDKPKVRIGNGKDKRLDPKFGIKASKHKTFNVELLGCGADNLVPSGVKQT